MDNIEELKKMYSDLENRCRKVKNLRFVKDENNCFYLSDGIVKFSNSYSLDLCIKLYVYSHEKSLNDFYIDFFISDFKDLIEQIPDEEINVDMITKDIIELINEKYYLSFFENEALFNYYLKEKNFKKLFTFDKMKYQNKILDVLSSDEINATLNSIIEDIKKEDSIKKYSRSIILLKELIDKKDIKFINKYFTTSFYLQTSSRLEDASYLVKNIELSEEIMKQIDSDNKLPLLYKKNKKLFNYLKNTGSDLVKKFDIDVLSNDDFSYELCTDYLMSGINDELTDYFIKAKGVDCLINLKNKWVTDNIVLNHYNELESLFKNNKVDYISSRLDYLTETKELQTIKKLLYNNCFIVNFMKKNKENISEYMDNFYFQDLIEKDNLSIEEYNEIYDIIVDNYFDDEPKFINSAKLLVCALERNDVENLFHFENFDSELIYPYYEKLIKIFDEKWYGLCNSSKFFEYCILNNYNDIVEKLRITEAHEKFIINNLDKIVSKYDATTLPSIFHSSYTILEYIVKNGYTDLIEAYDEKAMRNLFKLKLPEYNIEDRYDNPFEGVMDIIDEIGMSNDKTKKNDVEFMNQFIKIIDTKNSSCIFYGMHNSNKLRKYLFDNKRYDLFIQFPFMGEKEVENIKKSANGVNILFGITLEEFTEKINRLSSKNTELLKTMLPFMLTKKYDCFNEACLSKICLYPDLQLKLNKFDNHTIQVLARIYEKIVSSTELDYSGVFTKIINNIEIYKNIVDTINDNNLKDDLFIDNLIKTLNDSENIYSIKSLEDIINLDNKEKMFFEDINTRIKNNTITIEELKTAVFIKSFGVNDSEAEFLVDRYCINIEAYEDDDFKDNENLKSIINVLKAIKKIYLINDLDKLKEVYNSNNKRIKVDYRYSLEAVIRSEYAKAYSDSLYKINEEHVVSKNNINNQEIYNLISQTEYNEKHPKFYMMDGDFNLQVHALGAYREWKRPQNFKDDWYRPFIAYHGICTSYIGNNQIATARASHPIYGFSNYESSAYLCSGNYDLFSDEVISKFDSGYRKAYNILLPKQMIDNTRHTHNEIVIERTIAGMDEIIKRAPDYVLLFVDDINNKYNFKKVDDVLSELYQKYPDSKDMIKERYSTYDNVLLDIDESEESELLTKEDLYKLQLANIYEETIQASIDQDIPIVIVDRLKYAKKEKNECNKMFEKFKNNIKGEINIENGNELYELLLKVFNNMVGCHNYTSIPLEYSDIFSIQEFNKLFEKITNAISEISDLEKRFEISEYLWYILDDESNKRDFTGNKCQLGNLYTEMNYTLESLDKIAFEILKKHTINEMKQVDNQADKIIDSTTNMIDLLKIIIDYNINIDKIDEKYIEHFWRLLKKEFNNKELLEQYEENNFSIIEFYNNFIYNDNYVNMNENILTDIKNRSL